MLGEGRAPIDLVCVIDRSSSMTGARMRLLKETIHFMVENLSEFDQFGLVAFSTDVKVLSPLALMTTAGKQKVLDQVDALTADGCTNLSGGILAGLDLFARSQLRNQVSGIMVFTDGIANVGMTKTDQIIDAIKAVSQGMESNYSLFTFGFGNDHDPQMLKDVADAFGGIYYYIEKDEYIPLCFADCLGGLLSVVATNVRVSIEPLNDCVIANVRTKYRTTDGEGGKLVILLGDLYSEEQKDLLFSIQIPSARSVIDSQQIVKFSVQYHDVIKSQAASREATATISRPANVGEPKTEISFDIQHNRIVVADALDFGLKSGTSLNFDKAKDNFANALGILTNSASYKEKHITANRLEEDLRRGMSEVTGNLQSFKSTGNKILAALGSYHYQQRSNNPDHQQRLQQNTPYINSVKLSLIRAAEKARAKVICENCGQHGHILRECPQATREVISNNLGAYAQPAATSSTPATSVWDDKSAQRCNICGMTGHIHTQCPQTLQQVQMQGYPGVQVPGRGAYSGGWSYSYAAGGNNGNPFMNGSSACHSCGQFGHYARDCPKRDICHTCGQPGHYASACPRKIDMCHICSYPGHYARDCPMAGSTPVPGQIQLLTPAGALAGKCFQCGVEGHIAKDCKDKMCYRCGLKGHSFKDCVAPANLGEKERRKQFTKCNRCGYLGHFARECPT